MGGATEEAGDDGENTKHRLKTLQISVIFVDEKNVSKWWFELSYKWNGSSAILSGALCWILMYNF